MLVLEGRGRVWDLTGVPFCMALSETIPSRHLENIGTLYGGRASYYVLSVFQALPSHLILYIRQQLGLFSCKA